MTHEELKAEWVEKVKIINRKNVSKNGGAPCTVNTELYLVPKELENDIDILTTALFQGEEFLWNIPYNFKIDKQLVMQLIEKNYPHDIYQHIYQLREDPDIFEKCIERNEDLGYGRLPDNIINNKELILKTLPKRNFFNKLKNYSNDKQVMRIMLEQYDYKFEDLSKSMNKFFSKDKDFVLKIVSQQQSAYQALPEHLQLDPEVISVFMDSFASKYPSSYRQLPEHLQTDLKIVDRFLKHSPDHLVQLPTSLRGDKEFLMDALPRYHTNLKWASPELREDYDLVYINIEIDGKRLKDSKNYSTDLTLAKLALKTCNELRNLPKSLWTNKELVMEYLHANPKNCATLYQESYNFRDDYDIMKLMVAVVPTALNNYPNWQNEKELCEIAALHNNKDINLLSKEHLSNKGLILEFITHNPVNIDKLFNKTQAYNNDKDVIEVALKHNAKLIAKSPKWKADKEFVKKAIYTFGLSEIQFIDPGFLSDKEMVTEFLSIRTDNYQYLPLSLKEDKEIVNDLLKFGGKHSMEQDMYQLITHNSTLGEDHSFHINMMKHSPEYYHLIPDTSPFKTDKKVVYLYLTSVEDYNIAGKNFTPYLPEEICAEFEVDKNRPQEVKFHLAKYFMEQVVPNKIVKEEVKSKKKI